LGPAVGINWVYVQNDEWADFELEALNFQPAGTFCPIYQSALASDIVPTAVPALNVQVDLMVSFDQPAFEFTYCGATISVDATKFALNNTGGTVHATPAQTRGYRDGNFFAYTPTITWNPASESTKYILMIVDPLFILGPDGPAASFGAYVQHMLITNITGSNITTGTAINPYLGPGPPDANDHKYVYLVYEQPEGFALTADQITALNGRANFNLTTFVEEHNLGPAVGINWVYVQNDEWANFELEGLGFESVGSLCEASGPAQGLKPGQILAITMASIVAFVGASMVWNRWSKKRTRRSHEESYIQMLEG
jgi:hypothetical protein